MYLNLADSAVNESALGPWDENEGSLGLSDGGFWNRCKRNLDEAGIEIPYNQLAVAIVPETESREGRGCEYGQSRHRRR